MNTLLSPFQEFWKKGDKLLLLLCLLASVYGVALIFSATRYNGNNRAVITQCVAILLGAVIYILCTFIDFQLFVEKNWKLVFGVSVLFILLLLTPLGTDHDAGNLNWLDIPGFPMEIQPNEIDKLPFILLLALLITKIQSQGRDIGSSRSSKSAPTPPSCWGSSPPCAATWACAWCTPLFLPPWHGVRG